MSGVKSLTETLEYLAQPSNPKTVRYLSQLDLKFLLKLYKFDMISEDLFLRLTKKLHRMREL